MSLRIEKGMALSALGGRWAASFLAVLVTACATEAPEGEMETVDVAPARTAVLTTAYDVVADRPSESFSGVGVGSDDDVPDRKDSQNASRTRAFVASRSAGAPGQRRSTSRAKACK